MVGSLATFGYGGRQNAHLDLELRCALRVNKRALIIDIRLNPVCDWSPLWTREGLGRFNQSDWLSEEGIFQYDDRSRYIWRGDWLGNINYYKVGAPVCLVDERRGISWLVRGLEQDWTLILLCGCSSYLSCHRSYIYNKVKSALSGRLPEYSLGQRVHTPFGCGHINPHDPIDVHRARNRYGVVLDSSEPGRRFFFPDELCAI